MDPRGSIFSYLNLAVHTAVGTHDHRSAGSVEQRAVPPVAHQHQKAVVFGQSPPALLAPDYLGLSDDLGQTTFSPGSLRRPLLCSARGTNRSVASLFRLPELSLQQGSANLQPRLRPQTLWALCHRRRQVVGVFRVGPQSCWPFPDDVRQ